MASSLRSIALCGIVLLSACTPAILLGDAGYDAGAPIPQRGVLCPGTDTLTASRAGVAPLVFTTFNAGSGPNLVTVRAEEPGGAAFLLAIDMTKVALDAGINVDLSAPGVAIVVEAPGGDRWPNAKPSGTLGVELAPAAPAPNGGPGASPLQATITASLPGTSAPMTLSGSLCAQLP